MQRGRPGAAAGADDEAGAPDDGAAAEASVGHLAAGTGVWLSAARWPRGRPATRRWGTHGRARCGCRPVGDRRRRPGGTVRRFTRVSSPSRLADGAPGPAAVRRGGPDARAGSSTFLGLANDTPYPIRLETVLTAPSATVDDLGRGLRLVPEVVAGQSRGARPAPSASPRSASGRRRSSWDR
ncbi:MAG: hypothetical protein WKF75_07970 [Singulisphaera sp.]